MEEVPASQFNIVSILLSTYYLHGFILGISEILNHQLYVKMVMKQFWNVCLFRAMFQLRKTFWQCNYKRNEQKE